MTCWKSTMNVCAVLAAGCFLLPPPAQSQPATGVVGFWMVNAGGVMREYAFTKDGKFESKTYGSGIYIVGFGTYTIQGDRLTLNSPNTAPETYRWRTAVEYQTPRLTLTDSYGA